MENSPQSPSSDESTHGIRVSSSSSTFKGLNVLLVCSIAAAFAGFFVGMDKPELAASRRNVKPADFRTPESTPNVLPAVVYGKMNGIERGPNAAWENSINKLVPSLPENTKGLRQVSLADRALNRAFKGAPPVIPHRVNQQDPAGCMSCHDEGKILGDHVAAIIPHNFRPNCTQCHVESRYGSVPTLPEVAEAAVVPVLGIKADFVVQPLNFSHKRHAQADVELDCKDCHKKVYDTPYATFPKWTVCKQCHEDLKGKSADEVKLRDIYIKEKKEIPWIQVNRLPAQVYFSHTAHVKTGKMDCAECHGDMKSVTEPVTVSQVDYLTMGACMNCHQKKKASNDCMTCHRSK
jgi:5-methylcytosine-specific restriction endonuclease McrA